MRVNERRVRFKFINRELLSFLSSLVVRSHVTSLHFVLKIWSDSSCIVSEYVNQPSSLTTFAFAEMLHILPERESFCV
jgi:hypothetical protein